MRCNRLTVLSLTLVLSCLLLTCWPRQAESLLASTKTDASTNAPSLPSLRGDEALDTLKQQGLYDTLQQAMDRTRYRIILESSLQDSQAIYRAPNPAQGFDALFTRREISIQPRQLEGQMEQRASWQTALSLIGYGYKNDFVILSASEIESLDHRIELRHEPVDGTDRAVTEWYVNRAEGLEQGFVIHAQPSNKSEGERLRVAMKLSGDLKAEMVSEGQAVSFRTPAGTEALRYEKLFVTDAAGRKLAAQMRVEEGELWLEIEDDGAMYPLTIDPTFTQQAKLTAADGAQDDRLGHSVAISGETAVVGAFFDDAGAGTDTGSAYVFVRTGSSWSQQAKLTASDGAQDDWFGYSVAISGETAVIGAFQDDTNAGTDTGSAYVFIRTGFTWTEQAKLTAGDADDFDLFGSSVGISGETAIIGALQDDTSVREDAGSAYIFVRTGTNWTEQAHLTASEDAGRALFGHSVAISGETAVVGAPFAVTALITGTSYIFVRSGATWTEQAKLTVVPAAQFDEFGHSVAISGETVVIGAPRFNGFVAGEDAGSAFVFVRAGSNWSRQAQLSANDAAANDRFGQSVAISGETIIISAPFDDTNVAENAGSAYHFVRSGSSWSQQPKLTAGDAAMTDSFGSSVAISGETAVIGAQLVNTSGGTDAGAAYVFACSGTMMWTQQAKVGANDGAIQDNFGISVAISGETAVVGAFLDDTSAGTDAGSAYVFVRTGVTWTQHARLSANDAAANDRFGISVAISGETIIIGAFLDDTSGGTDTGSAYVFVRTGLTWTQQAKLTADDGDVSDLFGATVAISGETAVVGASNDDLPAGQNVGSAYVFVRAGTTWTRQAKLTASDGAADDGFGSVAISGETIAVGASGHNTRPDFSGFNAGAAYVFVRAGAVWSQQAKLTASDGITSDAFGHSLSISGGTIVAGAPNVDTSAGETVGAAYVFVRTGATWSEQAKLTASDGAAADGLGFSVAVCDNNVVVGSRLADMEAGAAYVFARTGTAWTERAKLKADDDVVNDQFGWAVGISGDTAIVTNRVVPTRVGAAFIFDSDCVRIPTSVELMSFTASAYDEGISLEWTTGFEVSNLGFNLYRDEGGRRSTINSSLIAGSALLVGSTTRLSAGHSYGWWDNAPADIKKIKYWLEALDLDGTSQWYGPVTVKFVGGHAPDRSQAALLARRGYLQSSITAPLTRSALPRARTELRQIAEANPATMPAIKIAVKTEGWYRITQPELVRAGLDPKLDPRHLQLFVDGRQLPISVTGEQDGRLDADDAVEFYAVGLDTASTDARVHWLARGSQFGLRIATVEGKGAPSDSVSFPYTVERRDRAIYFSSLINGERENFFGPVITSAPVDQSLALRHIVSASSEPATLEVSLQGVTKAPHNVHVSLNGTNIGAVVFNDQAAAAAKFNLPHSMLKEGDNQITLIAVAGNSDVSLIDYVRLTYSHRFTAEGNYLRFTIPANRQFTIDGFSNDRLRLLDVTDLNRVQEVRASINRAKNGYSISATATGDGERILVALTAEQARTPASVTANQPSQLRQPSNGADLIIITRAQFASSLAPLLALRQRQGLAVLVAEVEDIYDEFSFGQKSPEAIKDFLAYAGSSWKRRPGYVLFGGDASLDPRNYLGLGDWDFVPTRLIDTRLMETASDDYLADFDKDGWADLAAGRLPFRTVDEAARMVSKIIRYETSSPAESVLIASDSDDLYSFEAASAQLKTLIPASLRVEEVRRGQMNDLKAKSEMIEAINRGQKIVNYTGHGSVDMWRGGMLTSADMVKLNNEDRLALFVMMTCLNGYFQDTTLDSLAESLLKAERGGAVAVWASSGMTVPEGQTVINRELYRLVFAPAGQSLRLGEATRRAKAATGDSDVSRSWILFGDPTMRLK